MNHSVLDDLTLIQLIAEARPEALSVLYDRYARLVFSVALNSVGDRATAEEITQDVFLRVWQHAAQYHADRGKVSTWLTSIARHRAIDQLRRRSARPGQASLTWDEMSPGDEPTVGGPEQTVAQALERQDASTLQSPICRRSRGGLWRWPISTASRRARLPMPLTCPLEPSRPVFGWGCISCVCSW